MNDNTAVSSNVNALSTPRFRQIVFLLLVVFTIAKGLVWTVVSPVWQAPDEPAHVASIEHIARTGDVLSSVRFASKALDKAVVVGEVELVPHDPGFSGTTAKGALADQHRKLTSISKHEQTSRGAYATQTAGYPPLYYALGAVVMDTARTFGASYLTQLQFLRTLGVLLTVLALMVQYRILQRLFGDGFRALAGTALITLMPMYSFMMSTINVEILLVLIFNCVLLGCMRLVREGLTWKSVLFLAVSVSLGMLTKQTTYVLLPIVAACFVVATWRTQKRRVIRAQMLLTALLIAVGPFLLYAQLRGGTSAAAGLAGNQGGSRSLHSLVAYIRTIRTLDTNWITSFWGNFGWLDAGLPGLAYDYLWLLTRLSFVGALVVLLNAKRIKAEWVILIAALASLGLLLFGVEYSVISRGQGAFIQGRYLFPVLVAIVAIMVEGCTGPLTGRPWLGRSVLAGVLASVAVIHVAAIVMAVLPRYTL